MERKTEEGDQGGGGAVERAGASQPANQPDSVVQQCVRNVARWRLDQQRQRQPASDRSLEHAGISGISSACAARAADETGGKAWACTGGCGRAAAGEGGGGWPSRPSVRRSLAEG